MGDLPEPDTGVLSENLFASSQPPMPPQRQQHVEVNVESYYPGASSSSLPPPVIQPIIHHPPHPPTPLPPVSYQHRGVANVVDAASHLYPSKGSWSGSNTSEMQAVISAAAALKPQEPSKLSTNLYVHSTDPKRPLSNVQGGGSILQNINGKKEVKDLSIVSGLPPSRPPPVVPVQPAVPSGRATSYPPMHQEAALVHDELDVVGGVKRKYESASPEA